MRFWRNIRLRLWYITRTWSQNTPPKKAVNRVRMMAVPPSVLHNGTGVPFEISVWCPPISRWTATVLPNQSFNTTRLVFEIDGQPASLLDVLKHGGHITICAPQRHIFPADAERDEERVPETVPPSAVYEKDDIFDGI